MPTRHPRIRPACVKHARRSVLPLLLCPAACQADHDRADHDRERAARGEIDPKAPLVVHLRETIDAPPDRVWRLIADIDRWPRWQTDIQAVSITAAPAAGIPFRWTTANGTIQSRIAAFSPPHRLSWTGRLLWVRAIHVWTPQPGPGGSTILFCDKSLRGPGINWIMRPADLAAADQRWITALRRASR